MREKNYSFLTSIYVTLVTSYSYLLSQNFKCKMRYYFGKDNALHVKLLSCI